MGNLPRIQQGKGLLIVSEPKKISAKDMRQMRPGFSSSTVPVPEPKGAGPAGGGISALHGLHAVAYGSLPLGLKRR